MAPLGHDLNQGPTVAKKYPHEYFCQTRKNGLSGTPHHESEQNQAEAAAKLPKKISLKLKATALAF